MKVTEAPFDAALVGEEFHLLDIPLDAWQIARTCAEHSTTPERVRSSGVVAIARMLHADMERGPKRASDLHVLRWAILGLNQ